MKEEEDPMKMKRRELFFKMLGSKAAVEILQVFSTQEKVRYKDLLGLVNTHTLNARIRDFLSYGLIEHHITREETRKEWYELTEKGMRVLEILNELAEIAEH